MNGDLTLAPRSPRLDRPDRLVVVGDATNLPEWVRDWCHRTGRELHVHARTVRPPGHRPAPPDLLTAIAGWAADPVLVVPPGATAVEVRQVTAALHDLPDDAPVLAAAADTARHVDGRLVLTHGLPMSFAERSVGLRTALDHARYVLDTAAGQLAADNPDLPVETRLVRVHPHELVGENLDTGLLVIGGPRRRIPDDLGLVARTALNHATCPVLIVPR
jgi:nucleotide-binding universal stress UspA family protein